MKRTIRLTESDLHRVITESVKQCLTELDARTYASYAQKRQQQADNAANSADAYKYQRKANQGVQAAQNAWNDQYGYNFDNGKNGYGYRQMGGANQFTHNAGSNYGISSKHGDMKGTQNYAYNPKKGTEWHGNGRGESFTQQHDYDPGDNGAYRVADEMENGTGTYVKGKGWQ